MSNMCDIRVKHSKLAGLMAVNMQLLKAEVFWDMTLCHWAFSDVLQSFETSGNRHPTIRHIP